MQVVPVLLLSAGSLVFAGTIHGTVTNGTNGKLSSGDKVTLLSLSAGLDEVGSTSTNGKGQFTLTTPTEAPYLIRVEHEKGAYFKNVPPGTTEVAINVYDVATKVDGVSTEADVLRMETDTTGGTGQLKVTESYFVRNTSSPPRTEASEHTYEVALPRDATLEGASTQGPSSMPIAATPDPVSPKGHYAFSFPIRPNDGQNGTLFQLTYHVPYSGSYTFKPSLTQGTDNLVVMLPKTMKLEPGAGIHFQPVPDDVAGQTLLTRDIKPGQQIQFTVSGTGALPRDSEQAQGGPQNADAGAQQSGPGGKPGGGLGNPIDTPDPMSKYTWWILGGLGLVLVAAAGFLLRKPIVPATPAVAELQANPPALSGATTKSQLLLEALKEELFAIESEKIAGTLTPKEYAEVKSALETVLRRALNRPA